MLHKFYAAQIFAEGCEMDYRIHTTIDEDQYPQVHDFYEMFLIVSGQVELLDGDTGKLLTAGDIILFRPGDVHHKRSIGETHSINLAFLSSTMTALSTYLGQEEELRYLNSLSAAPCVHISPGETLILQTQMEQLALLSADNLRLLHAALRRLLLNCMSTWFIPLALKEDQRKYPPWMQKLLPMLDNPANLARGMEFLISASGLTLEHLCRSFQKYLNVTPNAYMNAKRLNYAANLLKNSDHSILDIAYEAGFRSESSFYHNFTHEYGMAPGKYRQSCRPDPSKNTK